MLIKATFLLVILLFKPFFVILPKNLVPKSPINSMSTWTKDDDKLFENGLVLYPDNVVDRWQLIADHVPGKTVDDIMAHYDDLVHDVVEIDAGRIELPRYTDDPGEVEGDSQISFGSGKKNYEIERKKGTPWTEEEHR